MADGSDPGVPLSGRDVFDLIERAERGGTQADVPTLLAALRTKAPARSNDPEIRFRPTGDERALVEAALQRVAALGGDGICMSDLARASCLAFARGLLADTSWLRGWVRTMEGVRPHGQRAAISVPPAEAEAIGRLAIGWGVSFQAAGAIVARYGVAAIAAHAAFNDNFSLLAQQEQSADDS